MKIGDVCVREVVHADSGSSIYDLAELMRQNQVGSVVIVRPANSGVRPIGIVTDRDLVVALIGQRIDLNKVVAEDIMSGNLITANENQELWTVVDLMQEKGIRRMPIVDDLQHLTGIFSMDDLLQIIASELGGIVKLITHERRKEASRRHSPKRPDDTRRV